MLHGRAVPSAIAENFALSRKKVAAISYLILVFYWSVFLQVDDEYDDDRRIIE